jgi:hypothetical protein
MLLTEHTKKGLEQSRHSQKKFSKKYLIVVGKKYHINEY